MSRYMKMTENNEELSEGEWVLIFNDKIIDHSANVEDMLLLAQEKFPREKFPPDSIKISKIFSKTSPRDIIFNKP
jgi:hypothetical protein